MNGFRETPTPHTSSPSTTIFLLLIFLLSHFFSHLLLHLLLMWFFSQSPSFRTLPAIPPHHLIVFCLSFFFCSISSSPFYSSYSYIILRFSPKVFSIVFNALTHTTAPSGSVLKPRDFSSPTLGHEKEETSSPQVYEHTDHSCSFPNIPKRGSRNFSHPVTVVSGRRGRI